MSNTLLNQSVITRIVNLFKNIIITFNSVCSLVSLILQKVLNLCFSYNIFFSEKIHVNIKLSYKIQLIDHHHFISSQSTESVKSQSVCFQDMTLTDIVEEIAVRLD